MKKFLRIFYYVCCFGTLAWVIFSYFNVIFARDNILCWNFFKIFVEAF